MPATQTASPPRVIDAIVKALKAYPALDDVLIHWGLFGEVPPDKERIYVLGTANYVRHHKDGWPVRIEDYFIRGLIEVSYETRDSLEVTDRLWDLIDIVDRALLEDADFIYGRYTGELQVISDDIRPTPEGWLAKAPFRIGIEKSR